MKLFDLHCDTLYECCETGAKLRENVLHINREATGQYAHYAQFFALFCGARPPDGFEGTRDSLMDTTPEKRLGRLLGTAEKELGENTDWLSLCTNAEELERAWSEGKAAAFLSIEGAELIPTDAHILRAYKAGVRMVSLSWNFRNQYACGAVCDNDEGLSPEGKRLVEKLVDMGVIIDVSHLSERGFWDVCELTDVPFVASHSNSRSICRHLRNLTDGQFSELVRRGGLAGVNLYASFLSWQNGAVIDDAIRHIEHFLSLGGENTLALGCDFDGCDKLPEGIDGLKDLHRLAERMLERGFPEKTVDGLFCGNAFNFIKRML